jgi:asparagine synthase (glutamine-hydrolysing)
MCGLAGLFDPSASQNASALVPMAARMGAALAHRGPDDRGVWGDPVRGIALAHQRLSILDLSPLGRQPMHSADGRYVLAFNGEIYNFADLRVQLIGRGHAFGGGSDTEVLLAGITEWGLPDTLARCNGMFAIALWDRSEGCLWLARDRVGKKPLYYGWAGGSLVFGSELKALWQHPGFDNGVDPDALSLLLRLDYIPAPHCIHRDTFKLRPGCVLRVDAAMVEDGARAHVPDRAQQPFWSAQEAMLKAIAQPFPGDIVEAEEALQEAVSDAVSLRMVADVPVGLFLSGGTDSALVTALVQARHAGPVRTFTIGFEGSPHDESALAQEVATHLGTRHTALHVQGRDALDLVPRLPEIFDEPFADASQLPTALLCRLARGQVTVALSGDGGDELFFGYSRYRRALRNLRLRRPVPERLRRMGAWALDRDGEHWRLGGLAALGAELAATDTMQVYRNRVSRWRRPDAVVLGANEPSSAYTRASVLENDPANAMMLADFQLYLPDDLLCKVDRASMAFGLEARAPLLDWRVAELAWSMPQAFKFRDGEAKHLLRRVLRRHVPDAMVDRPKRGFGAPISQWLAGDLHGWAADLLEPARLRAQGHLEPVAIERIWDAFAAGQRKWHTHLWGVLMFQAWHDHWRRTRAGVVQASQSVRIAIPA